MTDAKKSPSWPRLVIGITGGLASGKSTVAGLLAEHGIPVIDTDLLAREAVKPGSEALAALIVLFGEDIVQADGTLNRKRLLAMMLDDENVKSAVEIAVHPTVFDQMDRMLRELAAAGHSRVAVEVPLLFEAGWDGFFDITVTVTAPQAACRKRLLERNVVPEETADRWIAAQMPLSEKVGRSDHVVENGGDLGELRQAVDRLVSRLKEQ